MCSVCAVRKPFQSPNILICFVCSSLSLAMMQNFCGGLLERHATSRCCRTSRPTRRKNSPTRHSTMPKKHWRKMKSALLHTKYYTCFSVMCPAFHGGKKQQLLFLLFFFKWYAVCLSDLGEYEGVKVKIGNSVIIRQHLEVL